MAVMLSSGPLLGAAAGSDARMSGCPKPVVINSGSGNQGITVSLPVITYAEAWKKSHDETLRALIVSNLVSIYIKHYIGPLSAFCGAVSASTGAVRPSPLWQRMETPGKWL